MSFLEKAMKKLNGSLNGDKPDIQKPGDQPKDEQELIQFVRDKVTDVRNSGSRVAQEGVWMTNNAYLIGFDSVYFDTTTRQFRGLNRPGGNNARSRLQVNKILPTCQRRQARICQTPPKWEVRPDAADQEAKDQARLEKDLLSFYIEKERILQKRQEMMMGIQACGHYYMSVKWNPRKGELLTAETTEVSTDGETQVVDSDSEFEGDIDVETTSAFEIFPDPLATSLDNAQYYTVAKVRKLDYFKSQYPERGGLVKEEDTWLMSIQNEQRINTMVGQGPAQSGTALSMKNSAIELTYYEKKSKDYPMGRMVVTANGVLLCNDELPVGEFPHVKWDDIPITQKYYPEAIITHLRPIQDQYNNLVRKRAQWTNLMLAGKWIAPKGSQLQQESFNNQSGEILYYTQVPGAPEPHQMQVPVIPQYAYTEEDKLNGMFYDIAGEGEISRGILPSASVPAIGMQLLLEQDQTRVSTITEQHEYAFAKLGKLILMYLEKYVSNERLLKISDPNSQYLIKSWTGNDLTSKHDVIVVRGSTAPQSLATKRNDIMNLYDKGLYGNPMDAQTKARVLRDIEFGDVSSIWADQSADFAQIAKTLQQIEAGIIPDVNEFDNHALHLQEKNRYRKSDKYANLIPYNQALLKNDMEEHLQELMKITAPQFEMTVDPNHQIEPQAVQIAKGMDDEDQQKKQAASDQLAAQLERGK